MFHSVYTALIVMPAALFLWQCSLSHKSRQACQIQPAKKKGITYESIRTAL